MCRPTRRTRMRPSILITAMPSILIGAIPATRTPITAMRPAIIPITTMPIMGAIRSIAIIPTTVTHTTITATTMDKGAAEPDAALLPLMLWLSPAFPVGSFAYSHGLEWAVEAGDIFDAGSLGGWLVDLLTFGAPRADAILFAAAFRAAESCDWPALLEANELAIALAASAERRLETTAQGSAFVAAALAAWDCAPLRQFAGEERIAYPAAVAAVAAGHDLPLEFEPPGLRAGAHRQHRLRRGASRPDRPDRRPEDSGQSRAAHPRACPRGGAIDALRSRLRRLPG